MPEVRRLRRDGVHRRCGPHPRGRVALHGESLRTVGRAGTDDLELRLAILQDETGDVEGRCLDVRVNRAVVRLPNDPGRAPEHDADLSARTTEAAPAADPFPPAAAGDRRRPGDRLRPLLGHGLDAPTL